MGRVRTAVLLSGNGTNAEVLMKAATQPDYPAEICLVISNNPDAYGLTRAEKAGVKAIAINHQEFNTRAAFDAALHNALIEHNIQLVCLAGFMRVLTPDFVEKWTDRILNIHPSLLPDFAKTYGTKPIELAFEAGVDETGCTVHIVTPEVDGGRILAHGKVPLEKEMTLEELITEVHMMEHATYPEALATYAATLL